MAVLYNRISQAELKQRLYNETNHRITLSFYHYFTVTDPVVFRDVLYKEFEDRQVFGRVYIASEGINAQISVPETNLESFKSFMSTIEAFKNIRLNVAIDNDGKSFWVLKIKVRSKIVADGIDDDSFDMANKGRYVNADEFNELSKDPETIIVDMRNHYEFEVGHFENAIEIPSDTFRAQLPMAAEMLNSKKENNIIMYCTGGIRCEKASAYMLHRGFKNVFHLEGGIINYVNTVKIDQLENKFHGKNFVFDDRLGERVTEEIIASCHQCGSAADVHTNCSNEGCHLLFIQCQTCAIKFNNCCSYECASVIALPTEMQKELRKGIDKGGMVFNKSKQRSLGQKIG